MPHVESIYRAFGSINTRVMYKVDFIWEARNNKANTPLVKESSLVYIVLTNNKKHRTVPK